MRGTALAAIALALLGAGGVGFAVARTSAQSERIGRLEADLARAGASSLAEVPPSAQSRLDPRDLDAIAERAAAIAALRAPGDVTRPAAPPAPALAPPPPTPDQRRALADAEHTLDDARARGVLRREDVEAMRASLRASGTPEAAPELARKIAMAINAGELKPEDPRAIFP